MKLPNPFAWLWNVVAILLAASGSARFLREERPALVVTKGLLCHFYGGLAAKRAGIPCIWYLEDFISERFGGIYRSVFGVLARRLPHPYRGHRFSHPGPVAAFRSAAHNDRE